MSIKNIVLGIAIIILTIFVAVYGINMFFPQIEYPDFCGDVNTQEIINTQERCEEINGKWSVYESVKPIEGGMEGFCDREYYCRQDYEDMNEIRSKKIFLISVPLGILFLIIGGFLFKLESVGAGLMGGGVGTLIYGAGGYWRYGEDWFRFVISLMGLIAVIWLAYWFNKKFDKKKK
ncbi:MAG: hypothetical protein KJ646_00355 [Nanoarchaeota archaeon]|nr:hypothetical protein [Nanoarchaeota archaeon]MBU4116346.1 hypothetical protein [Nanoarchaeota archaeon]